MPSYLPPGSESNMQPSFAALFMVLAISQPPRESYETTNFTVYADTVDIATQVGDAAEDHRKTLAKLWLGTKLPAWSGRCRIDVAIAERPGGVTEVSYWQ